VKNVFSEMKPDAAHLHSRRTQCSECEQEPDCSLYGSTEFGSLNLAKVSAELVFTGSSIHRLCFDGSKMKPYD
jgi:hypothetical protein